MGMHRAKTTMPQGETALSDQTKLEADVRQLVFLLCLVVALLVFHVIGWW
jgi:hypothetical protein